MPNVPMPGLQRMAPHERPQPKAHAVTMPFSEQLENIAPHIAAAARHVCPDDVDADEVARLAIERFASIGALEHGDAMFHLTPDQLLDEEIAEYADAIIYRARRMAIPDTIQFWTFGRIYHSSGYDEDNRAEALHPNQGDA